jgi:hypothetical protein
LSPEASCIALFCHSLDVPLKVNGDGCHDSIESRSRSAARDSAVYSQRSRLDRVVLAFILSLNPPSATAVNLALAMAGLPKDRWLKDRGLKVRWAPYGLPMTLHFDNGAEFHSVALKRGCERYEFDWSIVRRADPIMADTLSGTWER